MKNFERKVFVNLTKNRSMLLIYTDVQGVDTR
jgi:hypothetical protein